MVQHAPLGDRHRRRGLRAAARPHRREAGGAARPPCRSDPDRSDVMTTMSPTVRTATAVGDVLATVHETWMEQVATNLAPALSDEADFWSRWAVVRFLSDPFGDRFRLECRDARRAGSAAAGRGDRYLASARAGLEHTMADLMITGRRRSTGFLTARLARRLHRIAGARRRGRALPPTGSKRPSLPEAAPAADQPEDRPRALAMTALVPPRATVKKRIKDALHRGVEVDAQHITVEVEGNKAVLSVRFAPSRR